MKARLTRCVVLAVVSVATALVAVVPAASAEELNCKVIEGAGSSLQKIAQLEVWAPNWKTEECVNAKKELISPEVKYNPTSSGKGKAQWEKLTGEVGETQFPAFIGTDTAATEAAMKTMGTIAGEPKEEEAIVAVPVAQSAITVMLSLPVGCKPKAVGEKAEIKHGVLSTEFLEGKTKFKALLKDVVEPAECEVAPKVKVRSSNSGTTAGFKRYFNMLEPLNAEWKAVGSELPAAEEVKWPKALEASGNYEACCAKGSELATKVFTTPGTIGYADLADAAAAGFTTKWAEHENAAKEKYWSAVALIETEANVYTTPEEAATKSANCAKATYAKPQKKKVALGKYEVGPGIDWSVVKQTVVESKEAYPICTLTYDLAWNKYETAKLVEKYGAEPMTAEKRNTVVSYLKWVISATGGQSIAKLAEKHYSKLPKEIQEAAFKGVTKANIT